ncbi:hypothetical protein NA56DRAFT_643024 [Hyaloscypha hepaticicola]|uniref:Uncharacterized protein n=1 Tax=Hyaloscypha hepaticicola TaxID=2082293 RepID=A0A2J6QDX0_9HELO|nr:hypothetical protein NA56DRAFT_643024 [Hyaloscypha hepaticicola]
MPIAFADPTVQRPKWSKTILSLHWLFQFITLGIFQLITIFLVWALLASASNTGDGRPRPASHTVFTITMVFILVANAAILCTILYEWGSTVVPQKYHKIQIVKSLYFFLILVFALSSGLSLPMEGGISGAAWVWATLWRMLIFVGPFWSSLVYAVIIKRRVSREFGERGEVAL